MTEPRVQEAGNPLPQDLSGTTIGRFEIETRLGSGGMGEVYRAEDTRLKRPVALKRLAPALRADQRYRRRLLREAERASALNHPHIAAIYDILEQDDELFLVMEHVEGQTLRQQMSRSQRIEEWIRLAVQCTEALVAAAGKGIVHRDIKPENIMLTPSGQVKILDFGLARQLPREDQGFASTRTESTAGGLSGTPAYMAPEVLLEQEPDGRTDIFSLGVVLYEVAAGCHPFRADTFMATADRILREQPLPLTRLNPALPLQLERIVSRMLAKDPAERYANAAELLGDLRALEKVLVASRASTALPAVTIPGGRLRRTWPMATLALALLTTLVWLNPSSRSSLQRWLGLDVLPAEKNLAVLPFVNIGEDPENQAFCDGLTYTLTSKLTQLEQFHGSLLVVPASEVFSGQVQSVEDARQSFGVSLALTGSVQQAGTNMVVNLNLVDARSRRQLRSLTFDARVDDPSLLQGALALQVAQMLELETAPQEKQVLAAGHTRVVRANDYYLQGRGYLQRFEKPENIDRSIAAFRRALELDSRFTQALAGLGEAYWKKYEATRETEWVEEARQTCERALALDKKLAESHTCLGMVYNGTGDYQRAILAFQQALEFDPSSDNAYRGLARSYEAQGQLDRAETTFRKAIALRSGYWGGFQDLGRFFYRHGRYSEAEPELQRVIELTPDNVRGYYSLGALYHLMGRTDEAIGLLEQSLAIEPTGFAYSNLGTLHFFERRYAEAVSAFEHAVELQPNYYIYLGNLADAYRWTPGQAEKAPPAYRRAIELARKQLLVNPRDPQVLSDLALYWAKLGEPDKALSAMATARLEAPQDVNILFKSVVVYRLAGQQDRAVEALVAAVQAGYSLAEIQADPELADLRRDIRVQESIKQPVGGTQ